MSLKIQNIVPHENPNSFHLTLSQTHFLQSPKFIFQPNSRTHFPNCRFFSSRSKFLRLTKIQASFDESYGKSKDQIYGSSNTSNGYNFEAFLSVIEFVALASSAAASVYVAVTCGIQKGGALGTLGSKILVWQTVFLVSGVVFGTVIRQRQWRRISGAGFSRGVDSSGATLLERVERLEEDLRSSATIIRVLSRQLEKLGIRFRVTRKALKEPIAQTASLAQKNSEATRTLAAQEDILEKELGEIQKVLLAMQAQQQKQLELILAIGKAGKLFDNKLVRGQGQHALETSKTSADGNGTTNLEANERKDLALQKETTNDRP